MPSPKRRTISNSGNSGSSTKTPAQSSKKGNSSATAPASFEQVFGRPTSNQAEITKLEGLLHAAQTRLSGLRAQPEPTLALYRSRHRGKLGKEIQNIRAIEEALKAARGSN